MRADDFVTGDSARGAGQSSLVGTGTTNAVNTGLVGSATAIAKNMVIGGTELGDVDKMYQTGKSAIKGSVGAARVGSDLVKDTVDTAKTTAKAFKAGVIILFAMGLFPNLLSGFSGGEISGFKGDMWSSVCASVALMLIVIKSGTIARDVFGG